MHSHSLFRSLPFLLVALAGLLLTGCSPGVKMVGTWEVDSEKLQADLAKNSGGNPLAAMTTGVLSMVEGKAEFNADGTFAVTASGLGATKGTWQYSKMDGDDMVLAVKGDNESTERELRVRFADWDHLEMPLPSGIQSAIGAKTFPFKRIKKT